MNRIHKAMIRISVISAALLTATSAGAEMVSDSDVLWLDAVQDIQQAELTVSCDNGFYARRAFAPGVGVSFSPAEEEGLNGAGQCRYELRTLPAGLDNQALGVSVSEQVDGRRLQAEIRAEETRYLGHFSVSGDGLISGHQSLTQQR